jgi:hypothetical protein
MDTACSQEAKPLSLLFTFANDSLIVQKQVLLVDILGDK